MKRTKLMNAAAVSAALTLITACVIGGTFAKYIRTGESTDSARVAKFGVAITSNGDAFASSYATDDATASPSITQSVVASADAVAPGTRGDLVESTVTGTPEVAVEVSRSAVLTLTGWTDAAGQYYCPLVIHIGDTDISGLSYSSIAAFKAAVEAAIGADKHQYPANTNLAGVGADTLNVSWSWAFTGNDDVKDTYLGDQAAENNASTISLAVTTAVTQID